MFASMLNSGLHGASANAALLVGFVSTALYDGLGKVGFILSVLKKSTYICKKTIYNMVLVEIPHTAPVTSIQPQTLKT